MSIRGVAPTLECLFSAQRVRNHMKLKTSNSCIINMSYYPLSLLRVFWVIEEEYNNIPLIFKLFLMTNLKHARATIMMFHQMNE